VSRPTDDDCADCGADAFSETDAAPADRESVPLCFACYLDRLDRVRACALVGVAPGDEPADDELTVGAPSVESASEVARSVADELAAAGVGADARRSFWLAEARDSLGDYHARELARGARSETRHVYAATSARGTVVDAETRTDEGTRKALAEALATHAVETRRVRKRADVPAAVVSAFPVLAEHGATRRLGVEDRAWSLAKERGVSRASERAARNQDTGREFERQFRGWCEERGIGVVRGKTGIVRRHPGVADEVARKTDGLAGVPDFLVRGDGQRSFGDGWRPNGEAFVEVKRGTSRLTREQQRVVAHLKSHGFDVYVLRGEPDDFVFERR